MRERRRHLEGAGGGHHREHDSLHEIFGLWVHGRSSLELGQAVLLVVNEQHVNFEGEQGNGTSAVIESKLMLPCCVHAKEVNTTISVDVHLRQCHASLVYST